MSKITRIKYNLIFDKLSFTLPLTKLKRNLVLKRINKQEFRSKYSIRVHNSHGKGNRYKNNYSCPIDDQNSMKVSMYPINASHNFIRVELNPDKLDKVGMIKARKLLVKLLGLDVTETICVEASLTRLDLSVNLTGLTKQYFIYKTKTNYSSIQRSLDSEIESQIAGSNESRVRVTFYNKNLEQLDKGEEVSNSPRNYHRLEIRLRDLQLTMARLDSGILDVFNTVNFYSDDFLTDDWFSTDFREDVEENGLNSALHSVRGQ
jgi:hypothetical protein